MMVYEMWEWVSEWEREHYKRCYEDELDETHGSTTLCNQMIKSISDDKLPKQYAWETMTIDNTFGCSVVFTKCRSRPNEIPQPHGAD